MFESPLPQNQITALRDFALQLPPLAAAQTLPRFRAGLAVDNKQQDDFDPVTEADREAERVIREQIEAHYPDHGILGEEFGEKKTDSPFRWVLDPVDGTRAFICGVPSWTTLIALEYQHTPIIGLISQPYMDECWVGAPGAHGTQMIGRGQNAAQTTSHVRHLNDARYTTTDPRETAYFTTEEAAASAHLSEKVKLTRFGLDAYGYALIASGQFDVILEAGLQRYDAAALIPVVQGAHGVVTDWQGKPIGPDWEKPLAEGGQRGRIIAAATRELHAQALACIAETAAFS